MTEERSEDKHYNTPYYRELQKCVDQDEIPIQVLSEAIKEGDEFERECGVRVLTCNIHGLSRDYKEDVLDLIVWTLKNFEGEKRDDLLFLAGFSRICFTHEDFQRISNEIETSGSDQMKEAFREMMEGYEEERQRQKADVLFRHSQPKP